MSTIAKTDKKTKQLNDMLEGVEKDVSETFDIWFLIWRCFLQNTVALQTHVTISSLKDVVLNSNPTVDKTDNCGCLCFFQKRVSQ